MPAVDATESGGPPSGVPSAPEPEVAERQLGPLETIQAHAPPAGALPAPQGLSCEEGRESISLSWPGVEGASQYQVLLSGIPWTVTTSTTHHLEDLPENTRFEIGVQAGGDDGWGKPVAKPCVTRDGDAVADASGSDIPIPPGLPTCSKPDTTSITISWNAVADSAVTGYKVSASVRVSPTSGRLAATQSVSGRTTTSTRLGGLSPFTSYIVAVRAVKGDREGVGTGRPCSTKAINPVCPDGTATTTTITLDWSANVTGSSIAIYQWYAARKIGNSHADGRAVSGTTSSTVFTGLIPETEYTFRLWWKASQNGTWFEVLPLTTCSTIDPQLAPDPPTGLTCTATTTAITLSWNASDGANKYEAGYSPSNAPWVLASRTYTQFTNLAPDTEYTLHVRAGNDKGWSKLTNKACATEPLPVPDPPTGLTCAAATTTIKVSWDSVDGADDYQVSEDNGTTWHNPDGNDTNHTFNGLSPDTAYSISVRARNTTGWGNKADKQCSTKPVEPSPPSCGAATTTSATLEWEVEEGVFMWLAARATTGDKYTDGRKLDASAVSTVFDGLTPGLSYTFFFWWRPSDGAEWVKVLPSTACSTERLPAPTGLGCEASDTAIALSWAEVTGADAYQVSMPDYPWFTPDSASSNKFTGLKADTSYSFRVRAGASVDGRTGWGEEASEMCSTLAMPLGAPTGLACATSLTGASLSWVEVADATKYQVSSDGGTTWAATHELSSHTIAGLAPVSAHTVQVQAGNAAAWGGIASVVCPVVVIPSPEELMCATTLSSITLTWKAIDGVDGYTATLKSSSAPDAEFLQKKAATTESVTFTGLTAGGTYYLSAQGDYTGLAADTSGIWCFANAAPPVCSAAGSDFVVVSWQADDMVHQWRAAIAVGTHSFSKVVELASDEVSARFGDLNSETEYSFHLWWRSSAHSPWIQIYPPATCSTTELPPSAPTGLSCIGETESTITAQWDSADGINGYRVSSDNGTTWVALDGAATQHTLTGLTASTEYQIAAQAQNAGGWSPSAQATCSTTEPALPAPIGIVCTAAINSLELRWNAVEDATRYRVSKDSTNAWQETTRTALTLSGLAADSLYDSMRVQAGDADSWDGTKTIPCRTLPATALAAPSNLECTAASDSITLKWHKVEGATRYRAGYGHTWVTAPSTAREHTFGSLEADSPYQLRVQAGDADGWESVAAIKSCSTAAPPLQAPALRCTSATSTSATWGWTPVPGATGYQHRQSSTGTWQSLTTPDQASTTITFTAAAATFDTRIQLRVRATNATENGPEAIHDCHSAPSGGGPARPEVPLLVCAKATSSSITAEWAPAYAATKYRVGHKGNNYVMQDHKGAELSVTVTGLDPDQTTVVLVYSANDTGAELGVITCRTLAEAPQNLAITCTTNQEGPPTIGVTWDAVSGTGTYQLALTRMETHDGGTSQAAVIANYKGGRAGIIADGDDNTEYRAVVRARTAAGWTDWALPVTGRCPVPANPL